jgi:hypothetical protein
MGQAIRLERGLMYFGRGAGFPDGVKSFPVSAAQTQGRDAWCPPDGIVSRRREKSLVDTQNMVLNRENVVLKES